MLRTCCYFWEKKMCQLLAMKHCEYFYLKKRNRQTKYLVFAINRYIKDIFIIRSIVFYCQYLTKSKLNCGMPLLNQIGWLSSKQKKGNFTKTFRLVQSHYIEVTQGGVSSRAGRNWLWIFSLFYAKKKKSKKKNYKRDIMQLFSADATIFLKILLIFFCSWKHEKTALDICS